MEPKRVYREVADFDFSCVQEELDSKDPDKIIGAMLSTVFNSQDYELSLQTILRFVNHEAEWVRANARLCMGHMARIFRKLDLEKAIPHLIAGIEDSCTAVQFHSETALKDIFGFIRFNSYQAKAEMKKVNDPDASQVVIALYKIFAHESDFSLIKRACSRAFRHPNKAVRIVGSYGTWRMSGQILEKEAFDTLATIKKGLKVKDSEVQENIEVAISTLRYVVEQIEKELKIKRKDIA